MDTHSSNGTNGADRPLVIKPSQPNGRKYGTRRDLSLEEVRAIVSICCEYLDAGGTLSGFYESQPFDPLLDEPKSYAEETLRKWLLDPRFNLRLPAEGAE